MTKVAVITVPRIEPHRPPAGAAIIAAVCEKLNFNVTGLDLNIEFFNQNKKDYYDYDAIWDETASPRLAQDQVIDNFIKQNANEIITQNFDFLLISIFGAPGRYFTKRFLEYIRPLFSGKIIAGGMGVEYSGLGSNIDCFGEILRKNNLLDDYITGEGEIALINYFNGRKGPGINNSDYIQSDELDSLPWPEYKYFQLEKYDYLDQPHKEVFITGSRGCVRRCGYCDIEKYWPKFRYRSGQNIANEIIKHYEEHGITKFYFTDSLINGSKIAFTDMCEKLANYKFDIPIRWGGQFIFRRRYNVTDEHFAMIKEAGGDEFFVGFETGSDRLRFEMGKKFTNEDIDYQLEQFSKNKLKVMPLMFTGYVTETLQDHQETLSIFKRWQRYVADGTITGIELGAQLIILPGSPVERMISTHGIEFMQDNDGIPVNNLWQAKANPELTIKERVRRKLELHEEAMKYHWPVWRQTSRLDDLKKLILKYDLHTTNKKTFFPIPVVSST